jgi:hypothetical protein
MTMTTLRSFIAFLLLAGIAVVPARAADDIPDQHADAPAPAAEKQILSDYETVRAALSVDDLGAARTAAQKLATGEVRTHHAGIANSAQEIARAGDIAAARKSFKGLSGLAVALARKQKGYFIMHCPMADADWVQTAREVANPYFGRSMASCGEVIEETKG